MGTVTVFKVKNIHFGRGERIRTSGLHVPNVALYQAKLHPENAAKTALEVAVDRKGRQFYQSLLVF